MRLHNSEVTLVAEDLSGHGRLSLRLLCFLLFVGMLSTAQTVLAGETKRFAVTIAGQEVIEGGSTLRVTEGDLVVVTWRSDKAGELHLHGYDISVELKPGEEVESSFEAYASGRFPVTSHGFGGEGGGHSEGALLYLEVYPE